MVNGQTISQVALGVHGNVLHHMDKQLHVPQDVSGTMAAHKLLMIHIHVHSAVYQVLCY